MNSRLSQVKSHLPDNQAFLWPVLPARIKGASTKSSNIGDRYLLTEYRGLIKELPKEVFKPYSLRMVTIVCHLIVWLAAFVAVVKIPMAWPMKLLLSVVIGHCWATGGLLAHELLHGSIVRSKKWQHVFGFFTLFTFLISPTFWRFWHNNLHHSHTQRVIQDPDAYPSYRIFKHSRFSQWMFPVTPGSGTWRSYFYFFYWFSVNTFLAQFYFRFRNRIFEKIDHKKVNIELALIYGTFISMMAWAGPSQWLWVLVIPWVMQNYVVFSYISTNHNLSPLTKTNDPLENSLTVTNHPILEWLHLNFGYHVEHHLFPTMNPKRIKAIHHLLREKYPDRYKYMPKWEAIKALYSTSRIYKSNTVLMNPRTKETFPTLGSQNKEKIVDKKTTMPQRKAANIEDEIPQPSINPLF